MGGGFRAINLIQLLEDAVQKNAEHIALISDKQHITYEQLHRAVGEVAGFMQQRGIGKGDKVTVMLPNIPEFVFCYFGIVKNGAVVVPINPLTTPSELIYLLNNSDSKILITQSSQLKKYHEIKDNLSTCRQVIAVDALSPEGQPFPGAESQGASFTPVEIKPEDPAVMIYTAGLTGRPLGAVLTHHNLYSQAVVTQSIAQRTPDDVALALIPLFHAFGATANMLLTIRAGCSIVMMDRLTMDGLFGSIEREKITYISAVPRLFMGMIFYEKASRYDTSSLKLCVTGGSAMPADFMHVFEEKFNLKLLEGYGLTEASPVCSFNRFDQVYKPGSIGTAITGVEIKIGDDQGRELPRNQIGELIVRGENVMQGYYKNEAATAAVIKNGWLHTGDLGRMDEDGYIFITGLKKRMIITSGFNVYPLEVETVLNGHPAVKAARVSGKEDLMRGEIVKAYVILKEGAVADDKEIIRYCKTYLSNYKVPREVEFVQEIPASADIEY
ncbi:MAG TPA: long-chain fatty acid--CoA ligase [Smithella sp.]|nr:long-chain fatty acid--CoA ligase [Smithella sp.]